MATFPKHRGFVIDFTCVLIVGLIVAYIEIFVQPFKRGFFCDDDTIRYPLVSRQTVSTTLLLVVSFLTPIIVFLGVETIRLLEASTPRDSWRTVLSTLVRRLVEVYGIFLLGAGLCQITVDLGKYTVGRLRPHFIEACAPNTLLCPDQYKYVQAYHCTGDPGVVDEARLSFPSGHAALAFYTAVYISKFLQHRLSGRYVRIPRHMAQGLLLMVAWFTALSRVHDYMHHPSDVLAGIVVGTVWALIVTWLVIDLRLDSSSMTKEELRSLRTAPNHVQGMNSV